MNVFISYAQPDQDLAETAAKVLIEAGLDAWLDVWQVFPGDNWAAVLAEALRTADAMVMLITPHSVDSNTVQSELSYALGKKSFKGRLVPVYAAGMEEARVPWILKKIGGVDLAAYARAGDAFREVAARLKRTETAEPC